MNSELTELINIKRDDATKEDDVALIEELKNADKSKTYGLITRNERQDDLFNLVVSAIFRIGNVYKDISELYMKCYNKEFKIFQERLIKLKDVNPKLFGLDIKFCLNEDTLELQRELKEKKENLQEDNHEIPNDILEKTEEICESEPKHSKEINNIPKDKKSEKCWY